MVRPKPGNTLRRLRRMDKPYRFWNLQDAD